MVDLIIDAPRNVHPQLAGPDAPAGVLPQAVGELDDLIHTLVAGAPDGAAWEILRHGDGSSWIHIIRRDACVPKQGWKLHVSASTIDSEEVLRRAIPVLLGAGATFKVAESLRFLASLNQGDGGYSQIGKFMTIYPRNDAEAVALAVALDEATRGLRGPRVPSDRPLAPGSLVHYRYGGFDGRFMQTPLGEILPAIEGPDGELVPDRRTTRYLPPTWAVDPFQAAQVSIDPILDKAPLIGGRYLVLSTLHGSPRGAVHLAFDTVEPRACVLKQARQGGAIDRLGRDARDRLRYEAEVLARLADDPRFPRVYGLDEFNGDLFLAMEDVAGKTLNAHVNQAVQSGRLATGEQVVVSGRELVSLVSAVHARNLIFRDLKSSNVIVTESSALRLIDFELAIAPDSRDEDRFGYGTPGYMSPQQYRAIAPAITDDIYGLGALLYLLATGAEPSQAMDKGNLLVRPVQLLNPAIGDPLADVIARCLEPEPQARYTSTAELDAALEAALPRASRPDPGFGAVPPRHDELAARDRARERARRLGATLMVTGEAATDGSGRYWRSTHPQASGFLSRDLNTGDSGTVLALAELASELNVAEHRLALADGARWLLTAPRPEGNILPGLYVGEAAVAAALLRAGQVLEDRSLVAAAGARGHQIATMPFASPDLFNGTAGRIRLHLWLYDETNDLAHLEDAIAAGEVLLASAQPAGEGEISWMMPEGYGSLTGPLSLGYAHGVSGVADVLLDLFEATGDNRFRNAALGSGRWLARQAQPALADGSGRMWPDMEGGEPLTGFWCHGAPGIGQFFLHAAQLDLLPEAWPLAIGAARTTGQAVRFGGPTQCHGLAGNIEFLLDMYQATGDRDYVGEAQTLAVLLDGFARELDGNLVYSNDFPQVFSPDYLVGYAGIAVCQLRLAAPERLPRQLSRRGFRPGSVSAQTVR